MRELIAANCDRATDLTADYAEAKTSQDRVRLSAELRQLEIVLVRLIKQIRTEVPAVESLRTIKARRAARARWDRDAG